MRGIEFRVGFTDHHKAEEFLSTAPRGVAGVRIDARWLRRHGEVIEASRRHGVPVYVDPLTERFAAAGFRAETVPYAPAPTAIINRRNLTSVGEQASFVEQVLEPQLEIATALTPPHFFVEHIDELDFDVALVRQSVALAGSERSIRPILAVSGQSLRRYADGIAARYRDAGIIELELRVSPLGGDDKGPLTIQRLIQFTVSPLCETRGSDRHSVSPASSAT